MVNIPYGAAADEPNADDTAWTKLATINEHLEAGEAIPHDLARWLGGAIAYANQDADELLRRLGLRRGPGRVAADPNAWRVYGRRVCELEDDGMKPEAALAQVLTESDNGKDEKMSRTQLQKLRNEYRQVWQDARSGSDVLP